MTKETKKGNVMTATFWIMLLLSTALAVMAYRKDPALPLEGIKAGGRLFLSILPIMTVAFVAAGLIGQVLPRELMTRWLGHESGFRGVMIATLAGAMTPGGPFVQFPIVAALLHSGAGVAQMMAYLSAWSLFGVNRLLVWEVPMLGWRLALTRVVASLVFPPLIGLLTRALWEKVSPGG